ncbi:putative transcription factor C2H2 family [Helianthus annuus]|uniref:Transcription factor C2H2 family n=1 Tax=Helianthus annuus TaxID=4232 RepID=A0A9K3NTC3_HELAN|nr:E3 ubiquitin-protein ligase AIRP2 [Helianthus annuus]KAF5811926.1 putative transcription factor C2H2 family [Helianthus annuus]KAJ0582544.1 putative transcription factor C2H2 family [Helianthus annuus]KAJ0590807.1 putative transcription factor C2H2 family [Helianthus annuus]KAJ0598524.1 putative transcription factor C2H2 family [Helianthus annuus]KAJ0759122.1 putative transcription factor C2H2 family [Helianthus annuus]
MRTSFKDSLKVLEADIQHANTLASDLRREYDGACVQMRMSYSAAAQFLLFFVQWSDCHLAGALGLLRILIYKVYVDGTTTLSTHEKKASIREFYGFIYPSLMQLQSGVTNSEDRKQKKICDERYSKQDDNDGDEERRGSDLDIESEEECGICMEANDKLVLPICTHAMCSRCYNDWRTRSLSCPFCRVSLKKTDPGELWVYVNRKEVTDMATITWGNLKRFFMYIDKLPLVAPNSPFDSY